MSPLQQANQRTKRILGLGDPGRTAMMMIKKKEEFDEGENENNSDNEDHDEGSEFSSVGGSKRKKKTGPEIIQEGNPNNLWAKNLRDVVLSVNTIQKEGNYAYNLLDKLYPIIKKESHNLKTLELLSCEGGKEEINYCDNVESKLVIAIELPTKEIGGFALLEELKLTAESPWDLQRLGEELELLKSLQKLSVNFGSHCSICWDSSFPFESLGYVKELRIKINPECSGSWGDRLIRKTEFLQNLNILKIIDTSKQKISIKTFSSLIKNLPTLFNIRSLHIDQG